jgi:putative hydrolase of the HAD superfamily
MKNYIIFDCYQTLIYKKNLEKIVQKFVAQELGSRVEIKLIKRAYELIYYRYKFLHPRFKSASDRRNFYIKYNQELLSIIGFEISSKQALKLNGMLKKSSYAVYADSLSILKYFKQNKIPLGLIANWTDTLANVLDKLNLNKYFEFIYSSHDLKIDKPNPKIFEKALISVKGKYDKIYYIGNDYGLDIIPARQAGLTPVLVDRDNSYAAKINCLKIKNLNELKKIIK